MTEFEKQIYKDMNSVDRVLILLAKLEDFLGFKELMTKDDIKLIQKLVKQEKEKIHEN